MEYIMVPVPRERVQEVYRLLAGEPAPAEALRQEVATAQSDSWSDSEVVRAYRESPAKMKLFLDFLAKNPGEQGLTSEETANAVGYTRQQQAGMLGAFGNRVKRRYGHGTWFFKYLWSGERAAFVYSIDPRPAKIIEAAKG